MEQTKRREDTADTSPTDRRKADRFIKLFYAAGIAIFVLVIYQIIFANPPRYVYALEIAFIATALYHYGRRLQCFYRWRHDHRCVAGLLRLNWRDYCKRNFVYKEPRNYFEVKLLRKEDFDLNLPKAKNGLLYGRTLEEAEELKEESDVKLRRTMGTNRSANRVDLEDEEAEYIRDRIAVGDYKAANRKIDEVAKHNKELRAETERVLDEARAANCLDVVLNHFDEENKFDVETAEYLIEAAQKLQDDAEELGIRPVVVAALKNGKLSRAKDAIKKAEGEQRRAELKARAIARIRERIDQLPGSNDNLYTRLDNAETEEYGSRRYNMALAELVAQIQKVEEGSEEAKKQKYQR